MTSGMTAMKCQKCIGMTCLVIINSLIAIKPPTCVQGKKIEPDFHGI